MKTTTLVNKDVMIVSLALNFGLAATIAFLVHLDVASAPLPTTARAPGFSPGLVEPGPAGDENSFRIALAPEADGIETPPSVDPDSLASENDEGSTAHNAAYADAGHGDHLIALSESPAPDRGLTRKAKAVFTHCHFVRSAFSAVP